MVEAEVARRLGRDILVRRGTLLLLATVGANLVDFFPKREDASVLILRNFLPSIFLPTLS